MYHFEIIPKTKDYDIRISLAESDIKENSKGYFLLYPDFKDEVYLAHRRKYVAMCITNWINTVGKNATFKQIVRRFEQYCIEADKLKL